MICARDKHSFVAVARKRKSKGKQHPLKAESLQNIAESLATASGDPLVPGLTNAQLLVVIGHIFKKEHDRVTEILR